MPEGDTIFRAADVLRAALVGRRIIGARAQARPGLRRVPDLSRLVGATVASVEARGKHLLIGFDIGLTLRSHLRMTGSWHRYRPGERWHRPMHQASAILETAESVAVAFNTPVVELLTDADLRRSVPLTTLGPDLLSRSFDADEANATAARSRFRGAGERAARSASGRRNRECVQERGGLHGEAGSVEARGGFVGCAASGWAGHGSAASPGKLARRCPGNHRQRAARAVAVGVRARRAAMPEMRNADPGSPTGRARTPHVLVPALPAWIHVGILTRTTCAPERIVRATEGSGTWCEREWRADAA